VLTPSENPVFTGIECHRGSIRLSPETQTQYHRIPDDATLSRNGANLADSIHIIFNISTCIGIHPISYPYCWALPVHASPALLPLHPQPPTGPCTIPAPRTAARTMAASPPCSCLLPAHPCTNDYTMAPTASTRGSMHIHRIRIPECGGDASSVPDRRVPVTARAMLARQW
jgi:hypothetical protein